MLPLAKAAPNREANIVFHFDRNRSLIAGSRARRLTQIFAAAGLAALAFLAAPSAQSQNYPNRPIRLIIPYSAGSGADMDSIMDILPASNNQVYDVRRIIRVIVDKDSLFEMKSRYGRAVCTALTHIDGKSVGIIANNPPHKGGAIGADRKTHV